MDGLLKSLQDLLLSSLREILMAATAGAVLYIRVWVQRHVAVQATEDAERKPELDNPAKKEHAVNAVMRRLPLGVRPLTAKGVDNLVEKAVPIAKKRVSERPGPPSDPPPGAPNYGAA